MARRRCLYDVSNRKGLELFTLAKFTILRVALFLVLHVWMQIHNALIGHMLGP